MGIRLPCRDDNPLLQRRRSRDAGQGRQRGRRGGQGEVPGLECTIKANDGYVFTAPVGQFKPNAFGLYDMHGNAWQWCADWYGEEYYANSPADDPTGPDSGRCPCPSWRFLGDRPSYARSAVRYGDTPDYRSNGTGFRVARTQ